MAAWGSGRDGGGGLGGGGSAAARGVLGPVAKLQVGGAEVVSGELAGHAGVVGLAALVLVSVLAVGHGGAVLLHAAGRGHVGGIVAHARALVVGLVHVTGDDLCLAAAALGEGAAADLVVAVGHARAVHAEGGGGQEGKE